MAKTKAYMRAYRAKGGGGSPSIAEQITNAALSTNPNFSSRAYEYTHNCQRCVWAYEMNRRGVDCEAKARPRGYDMLAYGGWSNVFEGGVLENIGSRSKKTATSIIDSRMAEFGDGSRAILRFTWKGGRSGHVINVERVNGETVYIDAQVGRRIDIAEYMDAAMPTRTQLMRVDNLTTPSNNGRYLEDCITRR